MITRLTRRCNTIPRQTDMPRGVRNSAFYLTWTTLICSIQDACVIFQVITIVTRSDFTHSCSSITIFRFSLRKCNAIAITLWITLNTSLRNQITNSLIWICASISAIAFYTSMRFLITNQTTRAMSIIDALHATTIYAILIITAWIITSTTMWWIICDINTSSIRTAW